MRHDFENAAVLAVSAYLADELDSTIQSAAPVTTFYDAMGQDEADRVIVICESGETKEADPGCAVCAVEVGVKTRWAMPTLATDVSTHWSRVDAVRECFNTADPGSVIDGYAPSGLTVTHVETVRRFETTLDRESGFFYSSIELMLHCNTIDE